jgi:hypothetical protein
MAAPADCPPNAIGAALRDLGWSHARLMTELRRVARQEGVTLPDTPGLAPTVSRWINNHRQPNEFYRVLLSRAIGKPRAELFGDEAAAFTVQGPSELAIARGVDRLAPDTLRGASPSTHELLAWLGGLAIRWLPERGT